MNTFVVDSSAWIEYFTGTKHGKKAAEIIEDKKNDIITPVVVILELSNFFNKNEINFEELYGIILKNSKIFYMNEENAKQTGKMHSQLKKNNKKISSSDCFILFVARSLNAKIVTKDLDFKGFKEAIFI